MTAKQIIKRMLTRYPRPLILWVFSALISFQIGCNDDPKTSNGGGGKDSTGTGGKPFDTVIIVPPTDTVANYRLYWPDRRPIGMVMFANWRPSAVPPNYRNWYLQGSYDYPDFKSAVFAHVNASIKNLQDIKAQGVILWDIEGQKYPHSITYIGSPDSLRAVAPEMDSIADEVFTQFKDSGFRVGVCLRPTIIKNLDTWPGQFIDDPYTVLYNKIMYARTRWGCTLFYVDSNIGVGQPFGSDNTTGWGQLLPSSIFRLLSESFPDCLIMPEHQDNDYYLYTAPYNDKYFRSFLVPEEKGFQVLAVGDSFTQEELNYSVKQGNILISRVWYQAPEIEKIKNAYK